jgi:hypothetical protein
MANDVSKLVWGPGVVTLGTENGTPSTEVGMPGEEGYNLIVKPSFKRIKSGAYLLAVGMIPEDLELMVEGSILEASLANLDLILSANSCANLAGTGAVDVQSIKIVGTTMPAGTVSRTVTLSRGIFIQELNHPFKQGTEWVFPFQFTALQATTTPVFSIVDA